MTGLAALGCNPQHKWTITGVGQAAKVGGENPQNAVRLGTLGYSPDGGLYRCVQAAAAIDQYALVAFQPGYRVELATNTQEAGQSYGVPQVALANGEYGWALVDGEGRINVTNAAVAASNYASVSGTNGRVVAGASANNVAGIIMAADAGTATRSIPCQVMFPTKVT